MTVVKYSKRPACPGRAPTGPIRPRDHPVILMPRFRSFLLLALCTLPVLVHAQSMPGVNPGTPDTEPVFPDERPPEGGWEGLAKVLEALKPGVDTSVPPTASQITDRIESLLNQGRNKQALQEIEARLKTEESRHAPGTDVQLQFQHARALAALGRNAEAEAIYQDMTTRYPELPEPWNNLAGLYIQRGDLDQAYQAIQMALLASPKYGLAQANLGDIQLMLARRAYARAARLGVPGMSAKAASLDSLIKNQQDK